MITVAVNVVLTMHTEVLNSSFITGLMLRVLFTENKTLMS